ncbi:MAG TPA: hypothetical protein VK395_29280 [Gemmataceae bacterium]|nr:hypothetical protein [Gemmataceae bacterium]
MVHGYHVILTAYGFWLPNDPRGSWSDFVGAWELARFGKATKSFERQVLTEESEKLRESAKKSLKYSPVQFSGIQARAIARGFAQACLKNRYTLWACAILPEHTHVVIARHHYKVEYVANLLKGAATKQFIRETLHPLESSASDNQRPHSPWAQGQWKVFLDDEEAIDNAIRYVEQNPSKEGKPAQRWEFVQPFRGLEKSGWVTYL